MDKVESSEHATAVRRTPRRHLSNHAGVRYELIEEARRIIGYHTQRQHHVESLNTTRTAVKHRFGNDLRLKHVERLLDSSIPIEIPAETLDDSSPSEFELQRRERIKEFLFCCIHRQLALSVGRGMLTFRTESNLSIDLSRLRKLCLTGVEVESERVVDMRNTEFVQKLDTRWARFHNGVAAALAHSPAFSHERHPITDGGTRRSKRRYATTLDNTNMWLNRIMSHGFPAPTPGTVAEQGGFIFGMGLNGNISRDADRVDFHDYLVRVDERMSAGTLLAMAASRIGSQDSSVIGLLAIHLDALLPEEQNSYEFVVPQNVKAVAMIALGLLYHGSCDRYVVERIMSEITRPTEPESDNANPSSTAAITAHSTSNDRESLNFCAGIALGNVLLGKMQRSASYGLGDLNLTNRLLFNMRGGPIQDALFCMRDKRRLTRHAGRSSKCVYEKNCINVNITSVGATIALGLMYLKTENFDVASELKVPETELELSQTRPDFWFWRILARNLILWNSIEPTDDWMQSNIPEFLRNANIFHVHAMTRTNRTAYEACSRLDQRYSDLCLCYTSHAYMQLGAIFALALKYAGSCNADADALISKHLAIYFRYAMKEAGVDASVLEADDLTTAFSSTMRDAVKNLHSEKRSARDQAAEWPTKSMRVESTDLPPSLTKSTKRKNISSTRTEDDEGFTIPALPVRASNSGENSNVVRRFPQGSARSAAIREPTRRRGNTYRDLVEEIIDARFASQSNADQDEAYDAVEQRMAGVANAVASAVDADELAFAESTVRALLLPPPLSPPALPVSIVLQQPQQESLSNPPPLQRYRRTNLSDEDIANAALSSGDLDLLNELLLPPPPPMLSGSLVSRVAERFAPASSSFFTPDLSNVAGVQNRVPVSRAAAAALEAAAEVTGASFRLLATPYGLPSSAAGASNSAAANGNGVATSSSTTTSPFHEQTSSSRASLTGTLRGNLMNCFKATRQYPHGPSPSANVRVTTNSVPAAERYDELQQLLLYDNHKEPFVVHCIGNANLHMLMLNYLVAKSVVMAGSGDLDTIRYCRRLMAHTQPVYGSSRDELRSSGSAAGQQRYGMYMAASMSLGFATLGCGRYTLSSSNAAIAALVTSLCPYWPRDPNDNKHHLQMLRHMYVLAVECRMLIPRALNPGLEFVALDCVVRDADDKFVRLRAPIMIAELPRVRQLIVERGSAFADRRGCGGAQSLIMFDRNDDVSWQTLCRILQNDGGEMFVEMNKKQVEAQRKRLTNIETVKRTPYEVSLGLRKINLNMNRELISVAERKRLRVEKTLLKSLTQTQILELLLWMPREWRCSAAQRTWSALFQMQKKAREPACVDAEARLEDGIALQPQKFAYLVELYTDNYSSYKKQVERMDPFDVYWRFVYYKQRRRRLLRIQQARAESGVRGFDQNGGFATEDLMPSADVDETDFADDQLLLVSAADRKEIFNALGGIGETPTSAMKPAVQQPRRSSILARRSLKRRKSSLPSVLDGIAEVLDDDVSVACAAMSEEEPATKRLHADDAEKQPGIRGRNSPLQRRSSIAGLFSVPKSTHTVRFAQDPHQESRRIKSSSFETPQRRSEKAANTPSSIAKSRSILKSQSSRKNSSTKFHLTMSTLASSMKSKLTTSAARQRRRLASFGRSASQPQSFASVEEEEEEEQQESEMQQQTATVADSKISHSDHVFARLRLNPLMNCVLLRDAAKVEAASVIAASSSHRDVDDAEEQMIMERVRGEIPFGEAFVYERTLLHLQTTAAVPTRSASTRTLNDKSLRSSILSGGTADKIKLTDLIDQKLTSLYGRLATSWKPFEFLVAGATAKLNVINDSGRTQNIAGLNADAVTADSLHTKWQYADGSTLLTSCQPGLNSPTMVYCNSASESSSNFQDENSIMHSSAITTGEKSSESLSTTSYCSSTGPTVDSDEFLAQFTSYATSVVEKSHDKDGVTRFIQRTLSRILESE